VVGSTIATDEAQLTASKTGVGLMRISCSEVPLRGVRERSLVGASTTHGGLVAVLLLHTLLEALWLVCTIDATIVDTGATGKWRHRLEVQALMPALVLVLPVV